MAEQHQSELTPLQRVEEWEGLYAQFRKETPSSPTWYHVIDYMVGAMISDHIEELRRRAADVTDRERGSQ